MYLLNAAQAHMLLQRTRPSLQLPLEQPSVSGADSDCRFTLRNAK